MELHIYILLSPSVPSFRQGFRQDIVQIAQCFDKQMLVFKSNSDCCERITMMYD